LIRLLQFEGFTQLLTPERQEMDLLDPVSTQTYFSKHRPQAVIHLASFVFGLGGNLKYQMRSAIENTAINNNIFASIEKYPVKNFFYAGTVASYPFPYRVMPLTEECFFEGLPHYGEFGYAMAKRHAYTYLRILSEEIGLYFTYGIFTNLYGQNDRFDIENGHVIPSLIAKSYISAQSGNALDVWGDGNAERDFLHAEDAARAILICLDQNKESCIINISSGFGVTIRHLAETIANIAGISQLIFSTDKPVGIPRRVVDNSQLTHLGFTQSIPIEKGLALTYEWYVSNTNNIRS
jgi:GDP-L-fucose synthase